MMRPHLQLVRHRAFARTSVGRNDTIYLRVDSGQEERPKRTLPGSKPPLLYVSSSTFATNAFILDLEEKAAQGVKRV